MSRIITIFLASSDELIHDRNSFHSFIATLDDIYEPRGVRIKLKRWEDFTAHCTGTRTQDDYNRIVRQSDMCIAMFHRKGGKFTIEEFHQALEEYNSNKKRPKTYVYIRALADGEFEETELIKFKEKLFNQIGHYWCNYSTDDAMKLHFVMQFEQYMLPNNVFNASEEKNLKVKNGVVKLFDREVARYENLPFASGNEQYKQLKEDIANANNEIATLRSINNNALESVILSKVVERNKKQEKLDELERDLFNQALYIAQIMSHDKPISERKRRAIELFQEGRNREAAAVLNEDEIAADCQRAGEDMERGRLLMQSGEKIIENAKEKIRSLIEEYIIRAKSLMADQDNPNRLQQACWAYEKAIAEATNYLDEKEYVVHLFSYAYFLNEERQYNLALEPYTHALKIYRSLNEVNPEAYLPDLATTLNNLAILQYDLHQYDKAEENYTEALNIRRDLANVNPETYLPNVATTLNNLANLQSDLHQYDKAEENYTEALNIRRDLAEVNPEAYLPDVAMTLNNLAILQRDLHQYDKAEENYTEALNIRRDLANVNPEAYLPNVATTLNNLANLQYDLHQYDKAEENYTEALRNYRDLAEVNPEAYLPNVATTLNNLAVLQYNLHQYDKAEENYTEALRIYRDLANVNPEAYLPDVATTLNNLANLQSDLHQYDKAEENYTEALRIYRDLAEVNPDAYRIHYAIVLGCISYMYILKREFIKAELCARDGIRVDSTQTFIYSNLASSLLMQGKYDEAERLYLLYKNELRDAFLDDFIKFEEIGIIPEEYREDVEKIKRILNERKKDYVPQPIDTSDIRLPEELNVLIEQMAKNVHEVWAQSRMEQGWTYGEERSDVLKQHPCLIPYEELPEVEKAYDRDTALGTLKLISKLGFKISKE